MTKEFQMTYSNLGVEEDEDLHKDSPERRLLSAVMMRAVTDLLCDSDPKSQQDAKAWFLEELVYTPEPFSFQFICMELELDPVVARSNIFKLEKGV